MSSKQFRGADSKINHCMHTFADYVSRARPQVAVFESVQQAFRSSDGLDLMRRLRAKVEESTGDSWTLYHVRHNAYSVGGCAQRRRYFWLISRVPFGVEVPTPRDLPLLSDVIADLAPLGRTWQPQPYRAPVTHPWTRQLRSSSGVVDGHVNMDNPLTRRIYDLIRGVGWHPGESISQVCRRHYETHGRLPESLAGSEAKIVGNDFRMGFTTPTRWNGDNPARVITGGSLQMVVHPWLDRMITHREAARVLGFPDDWRILPLRGSAGLHMTWGKGISVHCGRWIGNWIHAALNGNPGSHVGVPIGDREFDIDVTNAWRPTASARSPNGSHITTYPPTVVQSTPIKTCDMLQQREGTAVTEENQTTEAAGTVAVAEPGAETTTEVRRGRPRPATTIERDRQVYDALTGSMTREELLAALQVANPGIKASNVYLSLFRLQRDGRVGRTRDGAKHMWSRTSESPAPDAATEQPAPAPSA